MDYALALFMPMMGGLLLGLWLNRAHGWPAWWSMALAGAGFASGMVLLWKRATYPELYGEPPLDADLPTLKKHHAGADGDAPDTPGVPHEPGEHSAVGKIFKTLDDKPDDLDWDDDEVDD